MLTAFCGPVVHCDNHSLASFKDGANPPTAPSAACFVPSAESSHLVPASRCQLLPGQLLSQVSNRAHPGRVRSTVELRWSCQMLMSTIEVINHVKPRGVALSLSLLHLFLVRKHVQRVGISWDYILGYVNKQHLSTRPRSCWK